MGRNSKLGKYAPSTGLHEIKTDDGEIIKGVDAANYINEYYPDGYTFV